MLIRKNNLVKKKQKEQAFCGKKRELSSQRAQSLLEYMSLIGIVTAVLIAMSFYISRGVNGMIKLVADQVGNQRAADQRSKPVNAKREDSGYLIRSATRRDATTGKATIQDLETFNFVYNDWSSTDTETLANLGFRKSPER